MHKYTGVIPALITPFSDDGSIHETALRSIIDRNIKRGVEAFYVCGSSAEAFLMTMEERKRVFEVVSEHVAGRVPLICHVGNISTWSAIDLAGHAQEHGAAAISSIPPFYYNFTEGEIQTYYTDLISAIDLPMIVYNFPDFSGVSINATNSRGLLQEDAVIGIKHTSSDMYEIGRFKEIRSDLTVFSGYDGSWVSALAMGADATIGSTYNVMPEKAIAIQELYRRGRLEEAREIQKRANLVIAVLLDVGVFNGLKYLLQLEGIEAGQCRAPFRALSAENKGRLKSIVPILEEPVEVVHE